MCPTELFLSTPPRARDTSSSIRRHIHDRISHVIESSSRQRLCEEISHILRRTNEWHFELERLNPLAHEEVPALYVFRTRMMLGIV